MLEFTSDDLLKACGMKGGQIVLLRRGLKNFKEAKDNEPQVQYCCHITEKQKCLAELCSKMYVEP